jgi:hypothetical protein
LYIAISAFVYFVMLLLRPPHRPLSEVTATVMVLGGSMAAAQGSNTHSQTAQEQEAMQRVSLRNIKLLSACLQCIALLLHVLLLLRRQHLRSATCVVPGSASKTSCGYGNAPALLCQLLLTNICAKHCAAALLT